ncbi:hypothetical protein [Lysobacter sp. HA35]
MVTGGDLVHAAKLIILPAMGLALGARGDITLLNHVAAFVHGTGGDLDTLGGMRGSMSAMLPALAVTVDGMRAAEGYASEEAEIALVGWSNDRQCMAGWAWTRAAKAADFECAEIAPWRIGPNAGWHQAPEPPACAAEVEVIAREQVRFMRAHHPDAATGGRLVIAEIEPTRITTRTMDLCELVRHAA